MGQNTGAMRDREHGPGAVRGTPHRTAPPGTRDDTADIRQDIEQTRAEMSGTIDVIQHRLDPETLSEQAKDTASDITTQAKEAAREVVDHALAEAREAVQDATVHVKTAVREATIGKVETMVRTANDMTNEARYSMMDTIKQNPFPAVLAGIGIGWLYINSRSAAARGNGSREYRSTIYGQPSRYSDYPPYPSRWSGQDRNPVGQAMDRVQETTGSLADRAGSAMDQVGETAGNVSGQVRQTAGNFASQVGDTAGSVASQVGDTAGNFANQVGGTASDLAGQAQYQVYRLEDRFQQTLHSNPLAVGAAALVLGAAVGLALPSTRKEDELMGEARDTALDRVQSAAQETMEKAGQVAEKVQTTAKEESQRQGLTQ